MDLVSSVSLDVTQFDDRLRSWNELKRKAKKERDIELRLRLIVEWWHNYPLKSKPCPVDKVNIPGTVWDILSKFKISRIEQVYGIYYTIKLTTDNFAKLSLSVIQFKHTGQMDVGIIINNLLICDGIYDSSITEFNEIKKWEIC